MRVSMPLPRTLDPQDPTPYFYDAIQKQTTNRPVEALQDLQKAIELNDNRAVYRSRLLLDSDLAARSASPRARCTVIWVSRNLPWWKDGNQSTPIQAIFPPTDSWRIRIPFYPVTRSPGSANCCSLSCCSRST